MRTLYLSPAEALRVADALVDGVEILAAKAENLLVSETKQ